MRRIIRHIIKVTDEDISNGIPGNNEKCPIALAINRSMNLSKDDDLASVGLYATAMGCLWYLPTKAHEFMAKFDYLETVVPFSFETRSYVKEG